jgi:hypothetical protein
MTSTTTGLPDRYRPLDQSGPDEPTATGVIRSWRAKDRVLNRDVAIRVHTPAGPAAHDWITRALTAGGLATPALAMVYDASEGNPDPHVSGGAAYVVNEWIEGETLADRLTRGPLPEREVRGFMRRLAEGVAEAHRVGLAVGGLTAEHVVLRPNGLVGLRGVPAATGTVEGDIAALGALLEACLTGLPAPDGTSGARPLTGPSDLVALVRRARSTEPGQGLSSVAAMASLLAAERPRASSHPAPLQRGDESDSGWLRRLRDRRPDDEDEGDPPPASGGEAPPVRFGQDSLPAVPAVRPLSSAQGPVVPAGGDTVDVSTVSPRGVYANSGRDGATRSIAVPSNEDRGDDEDEPFGVFDGGDRGRGGTRLRGDGAAAPTTRRRLAVVGLPLLALAVVVALAWWVGNNLISAADSVDDVDGSTPSVSAPATPSSGGAATGGAPATIVGGSVFDPFGDGQPENDQDVPLSFDGDPSTAWSTVEYRGAPAFGNLKPGVGILYDLGEEQALSGVTLSSTLPGTAMEVRTGDRPAGDLDSFPVAASGEVEGGTEFDFDEPVTTRYVLVWLTSLVSDGEGFRGDVAEIQVRVAG